MTAPDPAPATGPHGPVAALVLAAGSGSRFGATKQLAEIAGRPLVTHALDTARAAGLWPLLLVVGHDAGRVGGVAGGDVVVVQNDEHASGQASSLRAGLVAAGSAGAGAVVVLLADEPGLQAAAVAGVVSAHVAGADLVRTRYDDRPGHPVLLGRPVWSRLRDAQGDQGARDLLTGDDVVHVEVDGPAPRDVDVPADLEALRRAR